MDLQAFRVASVTAVVHSASLAAMDTGGVLRSSVLQTPGTAA